jgi:hypothetical protein
MSPTGATRSHKRPAVKNMVVTSKRWLSFAAENDFIGLHEYEKANVFQTVKSGNNKHMIA